MSHPLNTRIAIIGAGPAGLSAAMELAELGYRNVVVFEKEPQVGGKCRSFIHEGRAYDLGANLTTPRYTSIRPLAAKLGLTPRTIAERRIVNLSDETFASLADASVLEKLVVRGGASLYAQLRHLTGIDRDGYAGLRDGVERPFSAWLDRHGLGRFRELFEVLFVAYGYGRMLDLPAAYALKFFDPIHLDASVDIVLGQPVPFTTDFVEGFAELWARVVAHWGIDVRLSASVQAIHRSPRGVSVRWTDASGVSHDDPFDKLVLACPLQSTPSFLDVSPAEAELFSQIRTNEYFVTLARIKGVPDVSTYVYPYARQVTPGWPTVFYPPVADDDGLFVFYAYGGDGVDTDVVRARIREVVADEAFRGELVEFVHTERWEYFPHVSSEAMRAGFYDRLEALQGEWHTYYVGELLSFTLVELNHRYSRRRMRAAFA